MFGWIDESKELRVPLLTASERERDELDLHYGEKGEKYNLVYPDPKVTPQLRWRLNQKLPQIWKIKARKSCVVPVTNVNDRLLIHDDKQLKIFKTPDL